MFTIPFGAKANAHFLKERARFGDLIGNVVDSELYYIRRAEFDRVRRLNAPPTAVSALYADMARLNALYMIAKSGSGHTGSSFAAIVLCPTSIFMS